MALEVNLSKLKTSWTKYDIVQVMEVIHSEETLKKFVNKEAPINEPILRSFLGMKSLDNKIPHYWLEIQNYPSEKQLFALFALIFTHGEIIKKFAEIYSTGGMKGVYVFEEGRKEHTNLRSALVESGASEPYLRREKLVPFDFSPIFQNLEVGKLFKKVLEERVTRLTKVRPSESEFYNICFSNNFHKTLSVSETQFKSWLEGRMISINSYVEKVKIKNFFSISEAYLNEIDGAKEVYFLGENGDGKSLVLMAIYLTYNKFFITEQTDKEKTGRVVDILQKNKEMELSGVDSSGKNYRNKNVGYLSNLFAYGTHRGRYSTDDTEQYGFMSLFDSNETLINPISWLKDQKLIEFEKEINVSNMNSEEKNIPSSISIRFLENMFFELLEKNVIVKIEGSEVTFIEKGTKLNFDQLSEGYKSIVIFISDLLYRLKKNQSDITDIRKLYGIVLVDEIDLHLHPKWQRVLIQKLRGLLPNVQFIFTTHSPTIIQGASNDAVIYRVYRNSEDGKTRVSEPYFRKDLNHLMINTLLTSPLFGLENSRLDNENDYSNTSETYLLYRINKKLEIELNRQKKQGKEFISDNQIDSLIDDIIDEELGKE
ncbi:putative ATP-binding protein involved in virulence [Saonia flava]|uniref:Putative ATP-binding protein involved in virulence n=1 Tax=Saonia flava TaxID=523696 RepID=A0A846QPB2_9FLAO|nr:AAA family ATPase [Saonia flava]NJB70906.1 putative ATP-binding protein involved in virulence [Saonia flava]